MKRAARYLIPLLFVIPGLYFHFSKADQTNYDARIDARIFSKKCQEDGRNKGGVVQYVFVANQKAYEGKYFDAGCRYRTLGELLSVKYVFESPDKNSPKRIADVSPLGALIWALLGYAGLVLISYVIFPKRIAARKQR